MSTINYTYNVIVDRFRQFSDGHFQLRRFTHGEISQADLEKEAEWPWMHVKPRAINYSPGTRAFSFEIFISDLPRDKEDKTGYQAESITDCSLIFQDLINEIHLGQMFGDDVLLTRPVNSEPFVEQYTHTLTGVTGIIELSMDYDWSACSIPASWNYNTPTNSNSSGFGSLQFIESLEQNGVFVSLDNDVEAPGNSYYYGTNGAGVKGWYASQAGTVTSVGLTAGTGISVSGGPITSSGSITVTNSAPDQVVALTAGTGITTSGTYPNFTITNSAPSSGGTVTSVAALTLGTTGTDLSSTVATSTTTPVITLNVPTASATNRGALSSADWSAFNGKFTLPALTSGSVLFSNGTTIAQDNANLFWDDTNNRLGIGTNAPLVKLQIFGTNELLRFGDGTSGNDAFMSFNDRGFVGFKGSGGLNFIANTTRPIIFGVGAGFSTFTEAARFAATTGNLLIGTTTDAGYKLDVNGTARVSGTTTITPASLTGATATSALDISQTWNTTGTPIALKVNITDTASAATSDLISLQVGGAVRFRVVKSGFFSFNAGGDILGNLCVGGSAINASSQLEVRSTTKGFLPPRMTTTQKNAIASPASGLVVYDTTLGKLCVRGAAAWETITSI